MVNVWRKETSTTGTTLESHDRTSSVRFVPNAWNKGDTSPRMMYINKRCALTD
jgi:hypothetical protein